MKGQKCTTGNANTINGFVLNELKLIAHLQTHHLMLFNLIKLNSHLSEENVYRKFCSDFIRVTNFNSPYSNTKSINCRTPIGNFVLGHFPSLTTHIHINWTCRYIQVYSECKERSGSIPFVN